MIKIAYTYKWIVIVGVLTVSLIIFSKTAWAQTSGIPKITVDIEQSKKPEDVAVSLQILFAMTILSLAPAIIILMTSFTRILVVFHFIRQALGTQQMPANQILIGLALFLTFFIMTPVWQEINRDSLQPFLQEEISDKEALERAQLPIHNFMLKLVREKDLALFVKFADMEKPQTRDDIPLRVLIPAFVTSELRIAFQIGFILYVPFLMIDMIVASVLMSMGMLMLPPIMISLPFKVLLFILVDGWYMIVNSVVQSFT